MTYPKDIKISAPEQFALLNDPDFLNQAVTRFLQQFLEAEISTFLQAEPYQRTTQRTGYRNGYKPRIVKTRVGRIELSVPQDREGRFHSGLFARFQRSEKALILALQEAYLQGVSTRKVTKITEQLCGTSFSKSQVSDLCQELPGLTSSSNTSITHPSGQNAMKGVQRQFQQFNEANKSPHKIVLGLKISNSTIQKK